MNEIQDVQISPDVFEQTFKPSLTKAKKNDAIIQLEGYSFAVDIWRFHYWERVKNGELLNGIVFDGLYYDGIFECLNQMGFYK